MSEAAPRPRPRQTRTFVELPLTPGAYAEIRAKLEMAGYHHAIDEEGRLDMHGIAVTRAD